MKIIRNIFVPLAIFPFSNVIMAQKKDSIPQKVVAYFTDKVPQTRDLNLEFTQLSPYKFSPELHGTNLPENKIKNFQQVKANANIYLIKNRKWMLSTSLNYQFTHLETDNSISILSDNHTTQKDFHYHSEAISLVRFSKLFSKLAIYSATVSVDGSAQHFERFRGMLTGTLLLKANANTKMSLGLAILIDPSNSVPVLPIFTYEYRFNNGWVADIILPRQIMMRKNIFSNGRFSAGTEMDNTSFYLYSNSDKRYEFRQLDINSGVMYEHNLGNNIIGTFKTGVRMMPFSRVFAKQNRPNNFIFDANAKPSFYFNLGISYNPFGKIKK